MDEERSKSLEIHRLKQEKTVLKILTLVVQLLNKAIEKTITPDVESDLKLLKDALVVDRTNVQENINWMESELEGRKKGIVAREYETKKMTFAQKIKPLKAFLAFVFTGGRSVGYWKKNLI